MKVASEAEIRARLRAEAAILKASRDPAGLTLATSTGDLSERALEIALAGRT